MPTFQLDSTIITIISKLRNIHRYMELQLNFIQKLNYWSCIFQVLLLLCLFKLSRILLNRKCGIITLFKLTYVTNVLLARTSAFWESLPALF